MTEKVQLGRHDLMKRNSPIAIVSLDRPGRKSAPIFGGCPALRDWLRRLVYNATIRAAGFAANGGIFRP